MKSLKSIGFAALCFSLVAAFAFKPVTHKSAKKFVGTLFVYNGGGVNDPTKYSVAPADFNTATDCLGTDDICAILTTHTVSSGTQPDVNHTPLTTEITTALTAPRQNHRVFTGGDEIWLKAN